MKITDIKTFLVGNPWKNWLFVKVETDEGLHGIGEGTIGHLSKSVGSAVEELKPQILGLSPYQIELITTRLTRDLFIDGGQFQMCVVSAIEIACWDIIGKAAGQPIYNLLGGACRDRVRAYANGWYRCPRKPGSFASLARDVVGKGYTALKVDPFGTAWRNMTPAEEDLSISIVAAIREAVGPSVDVIVEGHGRFSVSTAIRVARQIEPYRPAWFEDPVPHQDVDAVVEVARRTEVPIGTGESLSSRQQFLELLRAQCISIVTFEPLHVGGILASRKVADLVDAHFGVIAPHAAQGPLCTLACVHIDACTPNFYMQECFEDFNEPWTAQLLTNPPVVREGYLEIPKGPGLGTDLNMAEVEAHPFSPENQMLLFEESWELRAPKG